MMRYPRRDQHGGAAAQPVGRGERRDGDAMTAGIRESRGGEGKEACIATAAQIVAGDLGDVTDPMPADAGDYPLESSRHSRICQ